jgi:DNA-binding transcriptional ArsR family regulator/DNA-binding PadR family transcriptional regulator
MDEGTRLADLAAQLADRSRSTMVLSLMDGSSRPASELALRANLSAASASMHLAKLVRSGVLTVRRQGRNKFYGIATPAMAHAIEALGVASSSSPIHDRSERTLLPNPWGFARTCYDHLAGRLGVELALALQRHAYLRAEGRDFELTPAGEAWLQEIEVDLRAVESMRRAFAPQCLDWTDRRYHIAGALGSALLTRMLELGWLKKAWAPRLVRLTTKGEMELKRRLSLVVTSG